MAKLIISENFLFEAKAPGKFGAGILVIAKDTGRILLAKRGSKITYPNQWTNFGGGSDEGETPEQTARREFKEESGYNGKITHIEKSLVNKNNRNKYIFHNFIAVVPKEFKPSTVGKKTVDKDIEVADHVWATFSEVESKFPYGRLHYGIPDLFKSKSTQIKKIIKKYCNAKVP